MTDFLGELGRGDFRETAASLAGKKSGCPFCLARGSEVPEIDAQIFVLNGSEAGQTFWVDKTKNEIDSQGWHARHQGAMTNTLTRQTLEWTLFQKFPLSVVPEWWPPFGVAHSFLVDEIAVWLCNKCFIGESFLAPTDQMAMACAVLWDKKIAITPEELSIVLVAHGMPVDFRRNAEVLFSVGTAALRLGCGKRPVQKWRSVGLLQSEIAGAMRYWGRRVGAA